MVPPPSMEPGVSSGQQLKEACGVFGCVRASSQESSSDVHLGQMIYTGLIGLQHRGQESAGIVTSSADGKGFMHERGKGLVINVFNRDNLELFETGKIGIGHTRYSTSGAKDGLNCIQPYVLHSRYGQLALAHNGEVVNSDALRSEILSKAGLSTDTDSELLAQLLAMSQQHGSRSEPDWPAAIKVVMKHARLSYCLTILVHDRLYAVRDPFGNRPLSIGVISEQGNSPNGVTFTGGPAAAWLVSSESCAFHSCGASLLRDVEPGELVEITPENGIRSIFIDRSAAPRMCIFEYVYFARSDSILEQRLLDSGKIADGQTVYSVRLRCGEQLGREAPLTPADDRCIVSTVPESATPAALGYAKSTGIHYMEVLSKSRYEGRTFIQPSTAARRSGVARKFSPLVHNYRGKRVVLIDDSIVRGTTMKQMVELLKRTGAAEVHLRIASPPLRNPCYMGINIPTREELIANQCGIGKGLQPGENLTEMAQFLGADSVCYLSIDGLLSAVRSGVDANRARELSGYCMACLDGDYPVKPNCCAAGAQNGHSLDW